MLCYKTISYFQCYLSYPLSASPRKWPNTLKQFFGKLPTNCLSVFGHFVNLLLKGLTLAFEKEVLHRNNALSIVVLSTKQRYSSFSKKRFTKTCFKVKALKMFKICSDCHMKICRCLKPSRHTASLRPLGRAILKIPSSTFL